jgi:acetyl esterase/lipase
MINGGAHTDDLNDRMNAEWVWNTTSSPESNDRVVLYSHGGAYVLSSRRTHRPITSRIAKYADCRILSIDYRLAPQHVFPGPLVDLLSAYQFLLDSGFKAENICFSGDSAGGGLSTAAMLYCRDSVYSLNPFPMPGCIAVMSPFYDMTQSLPAWQLNKKYCYLPEAVNDLKYFTESRSSLAVGHDSDLTDQYASPIFSRSDPKIPICPLLIQVGDAERVRDDGLYFATETLSDSEKVQVELYQDAVHAFQLFAPFDTFSDHALLRLSAFIKKHTAKNGDCEMEFERNGFHVHNAPNFPTEVIPMNDVHGILEDGVNLLIKSKIWKRKGDSRVSLYD